MIELTEYVRRFATKQACADSLGWSRQLLDARLSAKKTVLVSESRARWYIDGGPLQKPPEQPLLDPERVLRGGGYGLIFEFWYADGWVVDQLVGYEPSAGVFRKGAGGAHFSSAMRTRPGQKVPREWLK